MARDKELLALRDQKIREVYERMRSERIKGRPKYRLDYIIHVISTKHVYVSAKTIERVLFTKER